MSFGHNVDHLESILVLVQIIQAGPDGREHLRPESSSRPVPLRSLIAWIDYARRIVTVPYFSWCILGRSTDGAEDAIETNDLEKLTHTRQTCADEANTDLDGGPEHQILEVVRDVSVTRLDGHDDGEANNGDDTSYQLQEIFVVMRHGRMVQLKERVNA